MGVRTWVEGVYADDAFLAHVLRVHAAVYTLPLPDVLPAHESEFPKGGEPVEGEDCHDKLDAAVSIV